MLTEYRPGTSLLHRLDIRTKLFGFTVVIILAFGFRHPLANVVLLFVLGILATTTRLPLGGIGRMFALLAPVFFVMFVVTAFACTPDQFVTDGARRVLFALFPGGSAPLTVGGIGMGVTLVCRMGVFVLASLLFARTTPVDDFVRLARRLRVSYKLAFIVTMAVRFVPTMEGKAAQVMDAQRARGLDLSEGSFLDRLRGYAALMIPMVVDSIRMSELLAIAMVNRGFGAMKESTELEGLRLGRVDRCALAFTGMLLVLGLVMMHRGVMDL